MAREQLERARDLIKAKRYDEARAILQNIDHPTAQKWLEKLDELDSPFEEVAPSRRSKKAKKERRGPGCLGIGLSIGCVAPAAFCVGLIIIAAVVAAVIQSNKENATEKAVERNGGLGTFEAPIPAGTWADFKNGDVRATRIVRPANTMVEEFNQFNADAPQGADYVLVWFELTCQIDMCHPSTLDIRLMDAAGGDWGEPWVLVLDDDFDHNDAVRNGTIQGWQAFEFPTGEPISTIKIEWGSETLHLAPPTAS